jgi:CRISPR-associated protein Csx10
MMANETLKFTIKTKSDLILATGKSSTSYIDSEMDFDEYGFPYISAKRFKGLLCHSAKQICSMPYFSLGTKKVEEIIFSVFGSSTKEGVCIFDNVCIQKYTENREYYESILKLNPSLLTRIDLINAISSLRTQTSIDETINIAKNQSLRTIRVLHRDYDFEGSIEITNDIHCCNNIKISDLITLSLLNLRRIGLGRNRGFGEIQCSVKKSSVHGYEKILTDLKGV